MDDKKEQRRAYMRAYYEQNKHKFRPASAEKRAEYNANRRAKYSTDSDMQEKYRAYAREWAAANPDKRKSQRVRKYGLDAAGYVSLLESQSGRCAICKSEHCGDRRGGSFHVDHCHSTGKTRGLLCSQCNLGLGKFKDSIESLERAIEYLKKWSSPDQ